MRASRFLCLVGAGLIAFSAAGVQGAVVEVIPVRASGVQGVDWDLGPGANEITLAAGGQSVEVFVRISGFAGQDVATYQTGTECSDFVTGEFEASTAVCPNDGDFGTIFCMGVDESQPDYILAAASGTLPACQSIQACPSTLSGQYECGSVLLFGDGGMDDGSNFYANQFAYDLSGAARGSYTVNLTNDPNRTLIRDSMAREVPITEIIPATITIPVGACCGVTGGNGLGCADDQTEGECDTAGGGWFPGATCSGVDTDPADGLDDFCPICDVDSDCDDGNACTQDTCTPGGCDNTDTTPAGQCCNPGNGSLTAIDDGDPCTDDVCNADGSVSHPPAAAGTACDDGNGCTAGDVCDGAGGCAGNDINLIECPNGIGDCPAGSQSCEDGFCVCTLETKMDIEVEDGSLSDPNCFLEGETVTINVNMGAGSECVTGGQFLITYDPSCLAYDSLTAGDFFPLLIFSDVDEAAGTVFAAVGIMPGGPCTQGPETLASLTFTKLGECGSCTLGYDSINPQNTILTNDEGNSVPLTFNDSKEISLAGSLDLIGPDGLIAVNPDCDTAVATVTWDSLSVIAECDDPENDITIECDTFHDGGVDIGHLGSNGGTFPQGRSSFTCTATNPCGFTDTIEWTVEVSDQHSLDVEVQLSPVITGDPLTRCICFDFFSDCVQAPTNFCQDLVFGFPYDFTGKATASLKVPKGQYACITAKDPLHTLRSVSDIDCVGNTLVAEFKGDPEFDGNWLTNGNLDCWKADGNGDTIDILDFGMFVSQYQEQLDPNTPCGTDGPHSDINGDGVVDGSDFTFISMNFLENSKNSCCDDGTASTPQPIVSITVKELRQRGLGELIVADINGDQVLDQADMAAFLAGQTTPNRTIKRSGSSRGSLGR